MKDITNCRFSSLIAIEPVGKDKWGGYKWLCKCDCGNDKIISSSSLIQGITKSCGCLNKRINKLINRVGEKFGRLTIIEKFGKNRKDWLVRCDCGVEKVVKYVNLTKGTTKSCGCWKKEGKWHRPSNILPKGEAAKNSLILQYKSSAKERNLNYNLTKEQFEYITKDNCYYCGRTPHREIKADNGNYIYNGIDRVDNFKGYEIGNVVPCCKTCNRAKDIMTKDEFLDWIKLVFINSIKSPDLQLKYKINSYENKNKNKIKRSEAN